MSRLVAPHEGRELELVLAGKKPMATIEIGNPQAPAVYDAQTSRQIYAKAMGNNLVAFCLPHNKAYVYDYENLLLGVTKTTSLIDYQMRMGKLFGYTDEEIAAFINGDIQCDCVECKGVQRNAEPDQTV